MFIVILSQGLTNFPCKGQIANFSSFAGHMLSLLIFFPPQKFKNSKKNNKIFLAYWHTKTGCRLALAHEQEFTMSCFRPLSFIVIYYIVLNYQSNQLNKLHKAEFGKLGEKWEARNHICLSVSVCMCLFVYIHTQSTFHKNSCNIFIGLNVEDQIPNRNRTAIHKSPHYI